MQTNVEHHANNYFTLRFLCFELSTMSEMLVDTHGSTGAQAPLFAKQVICLHGEASGDIKTLV